MKKRFLILLSCIIAPTLLFAQSPKEKWVDSVYNSLSMTERIGQLFMVAAYSGTEKYNEPLIQSLVNKGAIGGLIFMQGTPEAQAKLTNQYQASSKIPLLIGMDAEWGLGMRLTGVQNFPRQMMIGATQDPQLTKEMATAIAAQCKRLGVHIDFAPDIDINNNPANPVINFRSFGSDKNLVANLGTAYMMGLQQNGVMASAKHFPGHGDVAVDSHLDLPIINKSKDELNNTELFPFKSLIKNGIQSIMIAHLNIPSLDETPNIPSTLSYNIVTNLLQRELGFEGLIITDALNMEGVAKHFPEGVVDVKAFTAGNDVLLFSQNVPLAITKIQEAMKTGEVTEKRLQKSVKKILAAKYDAQLHQFVPIKIENATVDLNKQTATIYRKIATRAVTGVGNYQKLIDRVNQHPKSISYIAFSNEKNTQTQAFKEKFTATYKNAQWFEVNKNSSINDIKNIRHATRKSKMIVVGMHDLPLYPNNAFKLSAAQQEFLNILEDDDILVLDFGNPYALQYVAAKNAIVTYEENDITQNVMLEVLTKKLQPKGMLPVVLPAKSKLSTQVAPPNAVRNINNSSTTTSLRTAGFYNTNTSENPLIKNPSQLTVLSSYIQQAINNKTFPSCQIVALKDGQVVYNQSFGNYTYDYNSPAVNKNTMYDVASVTKIAATTLAIMKLYEQGKIDLNAPLGKYIDLVKGTEKEWLTIKDVLLHQAGLVAWIPFYKSTLNAEKYPNLEVYSYQKANQFAVPIHTNLYMRTEYIDTVWKQVLESKLSPNQGYVYSDLDFLFLQKVVESVSKQGLYSYVLENFYKPLGLSYTMYNPWRQQLTGKCAPTEQDNYYRYGTIQGYVHDMGAAMFGGVAGHAGLFSTAEEMSALMQMLLNKGTYNGKQLLKPETVQLFTSYQGKGSSRRGLGFDKPNRSGGGPCSDKCSSQTFGHQGFTGTCAWADPATGIVFVMLSNRTFPTQNNNLINKNNVRQVAQQYIYQALGY